MATQTPRSLANHTDLGECDMLPAKLSTLKSIRKAIG